MPASVPLYHEVFQRVRTLTAPQALRRTAVTRLSLLITGLIAAQSAVLARIAAELDALDLTAATEVASIERRLRRTLNDARLLPATCYHAELRRTLDWRRLLQGSRRVVLAVDDSSNADRLHLFRLSLVYWGGALPLAWAVWEQNAAQPPGHYWAQVDAVLAQVTALLPPGLTVVVTADRAFDTPAFVDRIAAQGWHWLVRAKARSALRFRDARGYETALAGRLAQRVPRPGRRWKARGAVFKDAGWRAASVVAGWAPGTAEPLVVLTDLPAAWSVLRLYDRRFWIEPGFRTDKTHGWQWESSQVQGVGHHERLLLAMAWASLLMLSLGVAEAQRRLAAVAHRPRRGPRRPGRPRHARESLFTLGLRAVRRWLYQTAGEPLPWWLPELDAVSWLDRWYHAQAQHRLRFQTVRP
jgi:hypothetical protein